MLGPVYLDLICWCLSTPHIQISEDLHQAHARTPLAKPTSFVIPVERKTHRKLADCLHVHICMYIRNLDSHKDTDAHTDGYMGSAREIGRRIDKIDRDEYIDR